MTRALAEPCDMGRRASAALVDISSSRAWGSFPSQEERDCVQTDGFEESLRRSNVRLNQVF
jgi:hypothetical protein